MEAAWEKEKHEKDPKLEVKHAYAFVLCKSGSERHKTLGIRLMQGEAQLCTAPCRS
jgi:hypothetical protein